MNSQQTLEQFYLETAVLRAEHAARSGNGPFAAVVLTVTGYAYWGVNSVTELNDPTAHAEVMAIREASAAEGFDLTGAILFSSCEPCPMCLTAALWGRVDEIVWAASSAQAAAAGFDDAEFYRNVAHGVPGNRARRGSSLSEHAANAPFAAWSANGQRVNY